MTVRRIFHPIPFGKYACLQQPGGKSLAGEREKKGQPGSILIRDELVVPRMCIYMILYAIFRKIYLAYQAPYAFGNYD